MKKTIKTTPSRPGVTRTFFNCLIALALPLALPGVASAQTLQHRYSFATDATDWLLALPETFGKVVFVSFSFGYDVTQILKSLPFATVWEICKRERYAKSKKDRKPIVAVPARDEQRAVHRHVVDEHHPGFELRERNFRQQRDRIVVQLPETHRIQVTKQAGGIVVPAPP